MTSREYKIYCKRRDYIKAGDAEGLEKFNAKLAGVNKEKVEQKVMEENK